MDHGPHTFQLDRGGVGEVFCLLVGPRILRCILPASCRACSLEQKHALLLPSQGVEHQPRGRGLSLLWSVFEDEKLERYESGCGVMENPATFIEHH